MTEPILTREEVLAMMYACDIPPECEPALMDFAERYEAAVLEKVCGEPVFTVQRGDLGTWLRWNQDPTKLPAGTELFALTRSKP